MLRRLISLSRIAFSKARLSSTMTGQVRPTLLA